MISAVILYINNFILASTFSKRNGRETAKMKNCIKIILFYLCVNATTDLRINLIVSFFHSLSIFTHCCHFDAETAIAKEDL
jgi:hypothetical protein